MERQNKATRRVLVVESESGSLFDQGLKSLLRRKTGWKVSSLLYADEAALLKEILRLCPDVIVLSEAGPIGPAHICQLLKNVPARLSLRVIVVRPDDNAIDQYRKQTVIASKSRDLIALIQAQ